MSISWRLSTAVKLWSNPDPKMVLNLGDEMIIIGEHSNIKALEEVV